MFVFAIQNRRWLTAGALLSLFSAFGQTFFISLFSGEIRATYGLSHGAWGMIYAFGTMASALVMLWGGALSDRVRVRNLGALSLAGLALACLGMAANSWAVLLPVLIFGLRFFGQGMLSHVSRVAMARWFAEARGKALAITTLGYTLGEALLPLAIVAMLPFVGWRWIWVWAAAVCLVMIPFLRRLLREERPPELVDSAQKTRHWRRREVLADPVFLLCLPMVIAPSTFGTALFFHQVHLVAVKGWQHIDFVALLPIYTGAGVVAMFAFGAAVDRIGARHLMGWYPLPFALGLAILGFGDGVWGGAIAFVLIGIMQGGQATVPAAFWAEIYGTRHLGAIKAMVTAFMVLGSAIGPGVTGMLIDGGVDFNTQLPWIGLWVAVCVGIAVGGLFFFRRPAARLD